MTETSTPMSRFTICKGFPPDITGCGLPMPAEPELRAEHRRYHVHEEKVKKALRGANKDLTAEVKRVLLRLQDLENDIKNIEIPEPAEPFTIVPEDELDPLEDYDDDWDDEPVQTSQYADDEEYDTQRTATRADAEAAFANVPPAIDRDDDGYFTPRPA